MKKLIVFITVALLAGTAGAQPAVDARAPEFSLQDQHEKTVSLREYEGRVVVLIASDKEGKAQNRGWEQAIRERYGERVVILGVANVSSVPFFQKGKIRNDFKKDGESILLDWKGEVFRSYGFAKAVSNIVLIDGHGVIRHRSSGTASSAAVQELFKRIDALN